MLGSSNHVASIHEGLKPLKCESCDYSSSLKHNMKEISHSNVAFVTTDFLKQVTLGALHVL